MATSGTGKHDERVGSHGTFNHSCSGDDDASGRHAEVDVPGDVISRGPASQGTYPLGISRAVTRASSWLRAAFDRLVPPATDEHATDTLDAAQPSSADDFRLLVRPALLGFLAIVAIVVGVAQPSSPFTLKMPGAWFFGVPSSSSPAATQQGLFFGLVAVYGGLLLLMRVWYELTKTLSQRPRVQIKSLAIVFALWVVPLLVIPPLFSRDIYSYAAQGEMMSRGISPYRYGPDVLGAGGYVSQVDPLWGNAPAPYGPLFLLLDGLITKVSLHHELPNLIGLRLLELLGVVLIAVFIPKLARAYGRDPGAAFALAVLNPVVVLHLIGGAHNDALMLGLLVAGITMAKKGRPVLGVILCTLAAAVKVPAALGVVYVGWQWMGPGIPWRQKLRPMITAGIISLGVMQLLAVITGLGWGWVLNLATPGTVRSWLAPVTAIGLIGDHLAHALGIGIPGHVIISVARVLGLGIAAALGLMLLWKSDRVGPIKAMGLTLLLVVALGPVVQPWYLTWGLVIMAPVATGRLRSMIIWLSICASFIGLPGGRQLVEELIHANPVLAIASVIALVAILGMPLRASTRLRDLYARYQQRFSFSSADELVAGGK